MSVKHVRTGKTLTLSRSLQFLAQERTEVEEAFAGAYPLGRVGTSDDIAAAAVWLASDECFMTGQNLQVNGGLTLRRNPNRDEITASVMKAMAAAG